MTTIEQTHFVAQESTVRGVAWGAIFSGVAIAVAVYLVLLILGAGLGFTALSPLYRSDYRSAVEKISMATLVWIVLSQLIALAGGGYIAGRLAGVKNTISQKIPGRNFYPIAHGMVVWALTSIALVFLLGTTASSIFSSGTSMVTTVGKGVLTSAGAAYLGSSTSKNSKYSLFDWTQDGKSERPSFNSAADSRSYDSSDMNRFFSSVADEVVNYALDIMFRPSSHGAGNSAEQNTTPKPNNENGTRRGEVLRIFMNALQRNGLTETDKNYVAALVSERTGLSHPEALRRVNETFEQIESNLEKAETQGKKALENARHAAAVTALWTFITFLGGALLAALAASYGGSVERRRSLRPAATGANDNNASTMRI